MKDKAIRFVKSKIDVNKDKLKDELIKLYFSCPPKVQFVLAKYVMHAVLNKKQRQNEELIRH